MSDFSLPLGRPFALRRPRSQSGSAVRTKAQAPTGGFLVLVSLVIVLNLIGLMMVLSSSSVQALRQNGDSWMYFKKQCMWVGIGSGVLVATMRLDYRRWAKLATPLLAIAVVLLLAVLVPGVGVRVSGSTRWLGAGALRIQPSELAKFAVLVFIADLLARRAAKVNDTRLTLRPVMLVFGGVAFLVMLQPDMGTTLVLTSIVFAILFVAGTPLGSMFKVIGLGVGAAFVLGLVEPYRRERMLSFLDPMKDAGNSGYQVVQSLVGLSTGHLTGVGLGASRAKWGYLPNAHTDFIFAIIGEELGLIGAVLVVALFALFAVVGVRTAMRAPDRFGTLLAAGITAWLISQAIINIGAVIGILPVTGVPLPFVSFGGSSLLVIMGATGVLLNVARQSKSAPRARTTSGS